MCFSTPSVPDSPPPLPKVSAADPTVTASLDMERRRQAMASGFAATRLTNPMAPASPAGTAKNLLGS